MRMRRMFRRTITRLIRRAGGALLVPALRRLVLRVVLGLLLVVAILAAVIVVVRWLRPDASRLLKGLATRVWERVPEH